MSSRAGSVPRRRSIAQVQIYCRSYCCHCYRILHSFTAHACSLLVSLFRDLKPDNLLLEQDCTLKITDFGLAVGESDPSASLSNYVVTRWYRSPELLLAQESFEHKQLFTPALDIWSVGCILGELLRRKPLFQGDSSMDQLRLILMVHMAPHTCTHQLCSVTDLDCHFRCSDLPQLDMTNGCPVLNCANTSQLLGHQRFSSLNAFLRIVAHLCWT